MWWTRDDGAFTVTNYYCNCLSIIATQRVFWKQFKIAPVDYVPDRIRLFSGLISSCTLVVRGKKSLDHQEPLGPQKTSKEYGNSFQTLIDLHANMQLLLQFLIAQ